MAITRWNPWDISFFDDDFDLSTLSRLTQQLGQGLNLYDTEKFFVAEAAIPGINEDDIDISVADGIVTITAVAQTDDEERSKRNYYLSNMVQSYTYTFRLPDDIDEDEQQEAILENGLLMLRFKKAEKSSPKKIKIIARGSKMPQQLQVPVTEETDSIDQSEDEETDLSEPTEDVTEETDGTHSRDNVQPDAEPATKKAKKAVNETEDVTGAEQE